MKQAQPLLCVGSLAFDDLEMPSGTFENVVGGAATYSSLAASLLTSRVNLVGVVGEDFDPGTLSKLSSRGVDLEGVEHAKGKTFRWRGRYAADLMTRETLDTQLNVFADFQPKIPASYKRTPYVLLGNIHPSLQTDVVGQVEKPKLVAADTMNFWIAGQPGPLAQMLKKIDLLIINDEEARELSGIQNLTKAARDIRGRGPSRLIIKRGEFGALLFDAEGAFFVPAYPLEDVRDPTGAGDSFAGGFMGYVARTDDPSPAGLRRAMFYASALGSFCVEDIGTRRLLEVDSRALSERIASFARLVDYGGGASLQLG
jgi:sugar/nucleoside kinase (ribokinase family)